MGAAAGHAAAGAPPPPAGPPPPRPFRRHLHPSSTAANAREPRGHHSRAPDPRSATHTSRPSDSGARGRTASFSAKRHSLARPPDPHRGPAAAAAAADCTKLVTASVDGSRPAPMTPASGTPDCRRRSRLHPNRPAQKLSSSRQVALCFQRAPPGPPSRLRRREQTAKETTHQPTPAAVLGSPPDPRGGHRPGSAAAAADCTTTGRRKLSAATSRPAPGPPPIRPPGSAAAAADCTTTGRRRDINRTRT